MDIKKLLQEYIKNNYVVLESFSVAKCRCSSPQFFSEDIENYIEQNKTNNKFQKLLFKYIDQRNLKDSDVYNKVNIDRRLFSKIRNDEDYHPSKQTVILLALALELNEDEALSLLNSASYSLPKNNIFDLIIRFCFLNKIYDVIEINNLLYEYKCNPLN